MRARASAGRRQLTLADRALRRRAVVAALTVAAVGTAVCFAAFHPRLATGAGPIVVAAAGYLALGAATLYWLHRRGELGELLRPLRGDIAVAALLAAAMWGASKLGVVLLAPEGTERQAWFIRLYSHLSWCSGRPLAGVVIMWVAAFEEIAWRGFAFRALRAGFGVRRAFWGTTVLYALAHLPSAWLLAAELSGPNPAVVLAAAFGGAVWGFLTLRSGRLAPAIFAHALYSWAVVEFPLWRL
ncbi:MAG: CPBP family intramembrane metalloprotease [Myxococcales bacterium]|nr:CPBP family intramembrane metalloprotease [Myxococcales bacterium]